MQTDSAKGLWSYFSMPAEMQGGVGEHKAIAHSHHQLLLTPALLLRSSRCASADYRGPLCRAVLLSPHTNVPKIDQLEREAVQVNTFFFIIVVSRRKQSVPSRTAPHFY